MNDLSTIYVSISNPAHMSIIAINLTIMYRLHYTTVVMSAIVTDMFVVAGVHPPWMLAAET